MNRVVLDRVRDNPFQTRQEYGDIEELAYSIRKMALARPETSGLIQVPVGRVVLDGRVLDPAEYGGVEACLGDELAAVVELAMGHRRLQAFRYLLNLTGDGEYQTFPVEIQVLNDQAMSDIAWSENHEREDLTAVEEAEAIQKAMYAFGWTQAQVGERWGLSQPAVANKLRLLQLPEEAQAAIRSGAVSERHGRALLKALGKSLRIYERAALDVLPLPVSEEQAAQARGLVGDERIHNVSLSLVEGLNTQRCAACGGPVGHPAADGVPTFHAGDDWHNEYLCLPCARAAQSWEPPSVAEAEDLVERAIRNESQRLDPNDFPLDVEIGAKETALVGAGEPVIRAFKCVDCRFREEEKGHQWCRDVGCYREKKELWYQHLLGQLQLAARKKWPGEAIPPVIREWGGRDLAEYSETDKAMVEAGHCGPHCERLRFRYGGSSSDIRPFAALPFVFNCSNTNAYNACVKRYRKSLETADSQAAAKLAKKVEEEKREQARVFLARAEASVAEALYQQHDGTWLEVAYRVTGSRQKGQSVAVSLGQVAASLVGGKQEFQYVKWEAEDAVEQAEQRIRSRLEWLGVGLVPGVEELAAKLERVKGFLLDENGMPRAGLTPEQVRGNLANLERIEALVSATTSRAATSEQDRERLLSWIGELRALFPRK